MIVEESTATNGYRTGDSTFDALPKILRIAHCEWNLAPTSAGEDLGNSEGGLFGIDGETWVEKGFEARFEAQAAEQASDAEQSHAALILYATEGASWWMSTKQCWELRVDYIPRADEVIGTPQSETPATSESYSTNSTNPVYQETPLRGHNDEYYKAQAEAQGTIYYPSDYYAQQGLNPRREDGRTSEHGATLNEYMASFKKSFTNDNPLLKQLMHDNQCKRQAGMDTKYWAVHDCPGEIPNAQNPRWPGSARHQKQCKRQEQRKPQFWTLKDCPSVN